MPGEVSFRPSFFEMMVMAQFIAVAEREKYTGPGALREEMVRLFLRDALAEVTADEDRLRQLWIPLRIKYQLPRVGFEPPETTTETILGASDFPFPSATYRREPGEDD